MRITDPLQHPFNTTLSETTGNQNAVVISELLFARVLAGFQSFGFDPVHMRFQIVSQSAMHQCFFQRFVRIFILNVLAHDGNLHFIFRVINPVHQFFPLFQIALFRFQVQIFQCQLVNAFMRENKRHLVDGGHIFGGDHCFLFDITEERNF